jgi:hypothetical protein
MAINWEQYTEGLRLIQNEIFVLQAAVVSLIYTHQDKPELLRALDAVLADHPAVDAESAPHEEAVGLPREMYLQLRAICIGQKLPKI